MLLVTNTWRSWGRDNEKRRVICSLRWKFESLLHYHKYLPLSTVVFRSSCKYFSVRYVSCPNCLVQPGLFAPSLDLPVQSIIYDLCWEICWQSGIVILLIIINMFHFLGFSFLREDLWLLKTDGKIKWIKCQRIWLYCKNSPDSYINIWMLSLLLAKHNFCLYQLQCAKFSLILDLFSISIDVFTALI